jgi:O-acetyl-ADP-ribose deacetylase (regulator of RNase III)
MTEVPHLLGVVENAGPRWAFKCGNILDEPADVLICSANVSLNLSGGVGADLLGRYGTKMQTELHSILSLRTPRAANRGEVISYSAPELPYKAILHAVAVNGWYETTPEIVEGVVRKALKIAQGLDATKVALTALATGFGDLDMEGFAAAIRPVMPVSFAPVEEVCVCLMEDYRLWALLGYFKRSNQAVVPS